MNAEQTEIENELDNMSAEEDFDEAFDDALAEFAAKDGAQPDAQQEKPERSTEKPVEQDDNDPFAVDKLIEAQNQPEEEAIPHGWAASNPKLTEAWSTLPKDIKAEIKKREQDRVRGMHVEMNKAHEMQKIAAPMIQLHNELAGMHEKWALESTPLSFVEGVRQSVALREYIKKTPNLELAKQFLKAANASPEDLIDSPQDARSSELKALRDEINSLKVKYEGAEVQNSQEALNQYRQDVSSQVQQRFYAFAETRNVHGQPKYPSARDANFAKIMGSQIALRLQEFPDTPIDQHIREVYAAMGGQILDGSQIRTPSNNTTKQLKEAAASGYAKGQGASPAPKLFDNYDDAFNATLEEFGLLE